MKQPSQDHELARSSSQTTALPVSLSMSESCRRFPLSPSEGERAGVRSAPSPSVAQSAPNGQGVLSRREFLARGSAVAATSALAGVSIPWVHAAEDNTIRLAPIGCGGRGGGAAADAQGCYPVPVPGRWTEV